MNGDFFSRRLKIETTRSWCTGMNTSPEYSVLLLESSRISAIRVDLSEKGCKHSSSIYKVHRI